MTGWGMTCEQADTAEQASLACRWRRASTSTVVDGELCADESSLGLAAALHDPAAGPAGRLVLLTPCRPDSSDPPSPALRGPGEPAGAGARRCRTPCCARWDGLPQQTAVGRPTPSSRQPAPLRLLLAEDDAVNQRVGSLLLRKLGHDVDVAASGDETVDAVHRRPTTSY